jgi:two-component system chemotaxis response regulator CheY
LTRGRLSAGAVHGIITVMKVEVGEQFVPKARKPEGYDEYLGRPAKVLVVDDEVVVRKLLFQVLKSAGYEIVGEAGDGGRAVDLYRMYRPDIVPLDVEMPFMDGYAALEQILKLNPKAVVVMLTNQKEKSVIAKILSAGAMDYILKPINRRVILAKLRKIRGVAD